MEFFLCGKCSYILTVHRLWHTFLLVTIQFLSTHFAELHRVFNLLHFLQSVLDHLLNVSLDPFHLSLNVRRGKKTKTGIKSQNRNTASGLPKHFDGMMARWHDDDEKQLHLLLLTLSLHGDSVVATVVSLGAQDTHTSLVAPAEQLQEPLVLFTHPVLQHRHRFYQLVNLQGWDSQVRLQVTLTVRSQTHKAGLQGLCLLPNTCVTMDGSSYR